MISMHRRSLYLKVRRPPLQCRNGRDGPQLELGYLKAMERSSFVRVANSAGYSEVRVSSI